RLKALEELSKQWSEASWLVFLVVGSFSNVCRDEFTRNRHSKVFSLSTFGTELEISKNRLFIIQVKWRVGSWVEPVLPLKMVDDKLGEPNAWNHNQSGPFFPNVGRSCKDPEEVGVLQEIYCDLVDWVAL
nr:hypothetical protein [Tanacetum cinerariifolium]